MASQPLDFFKRFNLEVFLAFLLRFADRGHRRVDLRSDIRPRFAVLYQS